MLNVVRLIVIGILTTLSGCAVAPQTAAPGSTSPADPTPRSSAAEGPRLSCGGDVVFPASGLDNPTGAETASGEEFDALRAALDQFGPEFPGSEALTWRLVGQTEVAALFLATTPEQSPAWQMVQISRDPDGWHPAGMGGCQLFVAAPDGFGLATWALDPDAPSPTSDTTDLQVLVWERACSSGSSAEGRMSDPEIAYESDAVVITIWVRPREEGAQTCPLPPGTPATVSLSEPLGDRTLFDGAHYPRLVAAALDSPMDPGQPVTDLAGTAWTVASINRDPLPRLDRPRIEFDWQGRPSGHGYDGCDEFGFFGTFADGTVAVGDLILSPNECTGAPADVKDRFLAAFQQLESWSVYADRLELAGRGTRIALDREVPPIGDLGRSLADSFRDGPWSIVVADGVDDVDRFGSIEFADRMFVATGQCSFVGDIRFELRGAVEIGEVGWDTMGGVCPDDSRPALADLLEAVTSSAFTETGAIELRGAAGVVTLEQ